MNLAIFNKILNLFKNALPCQTLKIISQLASNSFYRSITQSNGWFKTALYCGENYKSVTLIRFRLAVFLALL